MNVKKLCWALGLILLTVVCGIGVTYYTGRIAIVSTTDFVTSVSTSAYSITSVNCHTRKYKTFGGDVVIVTSGVPMSLDVIGISAVVHTIKNDADTFMLGSSYYRGRAHMGDTAWNVLACIR